MVITVIRDSVEMEMMNRLITRKIIETNTFKKCIWLDKHEKEQSIWLHKIESKKFKSLMYPRKSIQRIQEISFKRRNKLKKNLKMEKS